MCLSIIVLQKCWKQLVRFFFPWNNFYFNEINFYRSFFSSLYHLSLPFSCLSPLSSSALSNPIFLSSIFPTPTASLVIIWIQIIASKSLLLSCVACAAWWFCKCTHLTRHCMRQFFLDNWTGFQIQLSKRNIVPQLLSSEWVGTELSLCFSFRMKCPRPGLY